MAYNTTPNSDVRADGTVRNTNYRTLWGVVYAVIALAIVAGAAMLFMRDRTAWTPYAPTNSTVESTTTTNGMGTTAPVDSTTAPSTTTAPAE
ncbi:MAG: hypothetical protein H7326_08405 [Bdellovibrionaceae bacterium]|nr:hypothetical protein [Pseudobdellovibrionaceae bacterium]